MDSFGLLLGHLVGDYIVQNDWMASNKTKFSKIRSENWLGHLACTVHCLAYTCSVFLFSFHWMPLWGLLVCFFCHWVIDRFRLARLWMVKVSGQKEFATGILSPWSIIVVDNTFHLLTLWFIFRVWSYIN